MLETLDLRRTIARKIRELRQSRRWTQADLAERLGVSQNWLSQLERGEGSFTAEQFLLVLGLFNVPATHFVRPVSPADDLQNSLARHGASHLQENTLALPSSELEDIHRAVLEALIDATPRVITALAPIIVNYADRINLWKIAGSLAALGLERRLPWVIDNTILAIEQLKRAHPRSASRYKKVELPFQLFLQKARDLPQTEAVDVLDRTVRTQKTLEELKRRASPASNRWGIVTGLQPEDFVEALEATDEPR